MNLDWNFEWACAANYSKSWLLFLHSSIDRKVCSLLLACDRFNVGTFSCSMCWSSIINLFRNRYIKGYGEWLGFWFTGSILVERLHLCCHGILVYGLNWCRSSVS